MFLKIYWQDFILIELLSSPQMIIVPFHMGPLSSWWQFTLVKFHALSYFIFPRFSYCCHPSSSVVIFLLLSHFMFCHISSMVIFYCLKCHLLSDFMFLRHFLFYCILFTFPLLLHFIVCKISSFVAFHMILHFIWFYISYFPYF